MARNKEHVVSMEGIFRREPGETSSGVTEVAQMNSSYIESTTLEAKIDAVMEAGRKMTRYPAPKIQKVIFFLRDNKNFFQKHYEPKAVSLGPIHHGNARYQRGENGKLVLTYEFVKGSNEKINNLYKMIGEKINELKDCFEKGVIESYDDESLIWMLLVDGCATLQYIYCAANSKFGDLNIKPDSVAFTQQDLFLLENQLPYRLLKWLMSWSGNEADLKQSIIDYINWHVKVPLPEDQLPVFSCRWLSLLAWNWSPCQSSNILRLLTWCLYRRQAEIKKEESDYCSTVVNGNGNGDPIHLLDLLRTCLLGKPLQSSHPDPKKQKVQTWQSQRNVQRLRAAGIHVARSKKKQSCLSDVYFTKLGCLGYLWLPPITVDDSTRPKFLNLIAYETCLDFKNDFGITSYVSFLDSLIRETNDVKDLRKAGILCNWLGSDDEVVLVFNEIGTDLMPNNEIHSYVRSQIHKHCSHMLNVWIGQFIYVYFDSPWTFLSLVGALLALALTAIQTWYAIDSPFDNFCKNLYVNLTTKR